MQKRNALIAAALVTVPLVGGLVLANSQPGNETKSAETSAGYICPISGEELPCPYCCPLNKSE